MKDIIEVIDGQDLNVMDTLLPKAKNVLSVQLGSLNYALDFGVDLKFFLDSELRFQNESFKAYLVQRLTENQINVSQVLDAVFPLFEKYTFYVGDIKPSTGGLIL